MVLHVSKVSHISRGIHIPRSPEGSSIKRHKRTAVIEQPQSGPTNYLVTLGGGECVYASADDGAGGFTWEVESDDCVSGCGACPTVDAEFLTEHGTPTALGETLTVACPDCTGPRWTGTMRVPTGDTLRSATTRRIYNIQQGASATPATGDKVWVRQYFGQWVIVGDAEEVAPLSVTIGCSCCDCLNCVARRSAAHRLCAACPAAVVAYEINLGDWIENPGLTLNNATFNHALSFTQSPALRYGDPSTGDITIVRDPCVWATDEELIQPVYNQKWSRYRWQFTQDGLNSSVELVFVQGGLTNNTVGLGAEDDVLGLVSGANAVKWIPKTTWGCLCHNAMKIEDPESIVKPLGLLCEICVVPIADIQCLLFECVDPAPVDFDSTPTVSLTWPSGTVVSSVRDFDGVLASYDKALTPTMTINGGLGPVPVSSVSGHTFFACAWGDVAVYDLVQNNPPAFAGRDNGDGTTSTRVQVNFTIKEGSEGRLCGAIIAHVFQPWPGDTTGLVFQQQLTPMLLFTYESDELFGCPNQIVTLNRIDPTAQTAHCGWNLTMANGGSMGIATIAGMSAPSTIDVDMTTLT